MKNLLCTKESVENAFLYLYGIDLSKKNWDFEGYIKAEFDKRGLNYIDDNENRCPWHDAHRRLLV